MPKTVSGFSKFTKEEKIKWLTENYFKNQPELTKTLKQYWNIDTKIQKLHDDFTENTISNFYMPYGIAPNFVINSKIYAIPMAVEESSVVAAAAAAAKFWSLRGGFKATVISTKKIGHIYFIYNGDKQSLREYFEKQKKNLYNATKSITKNMRKRGGGITKIELIDKTDKLKNYYQLEVTFETNDSMGANFINSCLEAMARKFVRQDIEIVMSILSNYVPECLVRSQVRCGIDELRVENPKKFAQKFYRALQIASVDRYRAVTHNKGIMNGIDAVAIATGNDFRSIEAAAHSYASQGGDYKSLTHCKIENDEFHFWIEVPLALGTVGGLTKSHPMAKMSLEILQNPDAKELMQIVATVGLAQNFAAIQALVTSGIQYGHMKMHLTNILNQIGANKAEKEKLKTIFKNKTISYNAVLEKLKELQRK